MAKSRKIMLAKRAKCLGCKALLNNGDSFSCSLGCTVTFISEGGVATAPRPAEKCYKPTTKGQMDKAVELVKKKNDA